MNEEEKQELETLRAEKLRREQVERAEPPWSGAVCPSPSRRCWRGATTATQTAGRRNSARRIRRLWRRT